MTRRGRGLTIGLSVLTALMLGLHLWVPRQLFDAPTSTLMTDASGRLLGARIASDGQWRFPPSDSVSRKFAACIIACEDHRFGWHLGVDPIAIGRALVRNWQAGHVVEGGSTLTMQLARMARGNHRRTLGQKIIESLWALDIGLTKSRREVLRLYASNAPFGGNTVGIDAAAWRYFGRDAASLSWAENATLAVLPNAPSLIHLSRNRELLRHKRNALLLRLKEQGTLTAEEYSLALDEPLPEAPLPLPDLAPHLLTWTARLHPGERVQTHVDGTLQRAVQDLADRYSLRYKANYISDVAVLVLDVESGEVLAYVGNSSQPTATSHVDNVRSERSPGSLLKPLLYAAMMNDGEITPRMLFADTPLNLNGFAPTNFSKKFQGAVPADEAVTRSLNVPLVRMLSQYGTSRFMSVLKALGMTTLHYDADHYGASLILGGAEVTLWEVTHIYANMARSMKGRTIDPNYPLSRASVWHALEAMSALSRPEEESDWQNFSTMKRVAWKTGTSWGSRDAWAIGITPRYAVGVWVGNATGEGRAGMTGIGYAAPVMFDVWTMLPGGEWFDEPVDQMQEATVCRHSGHIASALCADTERKQLPQSCLTTPACPYCRTVHLSADGQWQVNSTGESVSRMRTESRFVLPPVMEYYYAGHSATYQPLPPLRPDCQSASREAFSFIVPEHGSVVVVPRSFGGEAGRIVLRAACQDADATLFWHLDDRYIGQTQGRHELAVSPSVGQHVLTLVDGHGNRRSIAFEVN